jgi:outer membrane protein
MNIRSIGTARSIGIVLATIPALAQLQNRPPTLRLSLKQAVEIAVAPEGNTRVQLAEEAIKQSQSQAGEARAALLPDLESYVTGENETRNLSTFGIQFPAIPGFTIPTVVGPFSVFDVRAQATQTVFDFSSIRRYQAAKVSVSAVKADSEGTRNQVTDQVARAYLTAIRAQATLETAQANVDLSNALLTLARRQKQAGVGTGIEITRAQSQLANDQQQFAVASNDVEKTKLQLLKVLGVRLNNPVELTDKLAYAPMAPVNEDEALATAREHRAELEAQHRREESSRLNYSAVKMERLPSVSAFGDYGTTGSSVTNAFPTRTIGITVRVPLFDGGRRDERRAESASQYRQERIRTADLTDQIELDVRVAIESLRSAEAQIKASEEGLRLGEGELEQAERRYKAGVGIDVEVTDAQTRLQRARENHITALYNYNLARIDLGTATGTIQNMIP